VFVDGSGLALALFDLLVLLAHLCDLFVGLVVLLVGDSGLVDAVFTSLLRFPVARPDLPESSCGLLLGLVDGGGDFWPGFTFALEEEEFCVFFGGEDRGLGVGLRFVAVGLGFFGCLVCVCGFVVGSCFLAGGL